MTDRTPPQPPPPGLDDDLITVALAELIEGLGESSRTPIWCLTGDAKHCGLCAPAGRLKAGR